MKNRISMSSSISWVGILLTIAVLLGCALMLSACDAQPASTADKESHAQDQLTSESIAAVGMPAITNFAEKRNYKMIFEKRDDPNFATYTYLIGMNNEHTPLCHSVGYGIPESEQYTAPTSMQKTVSTGDHYWEILPQADPNGLYSSPSANGTWVMCLTKKGDVQPVRSEPNVITLPVPWAQLNQDGM